MPKRFPTLFFEGQLFKKHIKSSFHHSAQEVIEALDLADQAHTLPSILIVSLELEQHNGLEVLHEIRSQRHWQGMPICLITINNNQLLGMTDELLDGYGVQSVYDYADFNPAVVSEEIQKSIIQKVEF